MADNKNITFAHWLRIFVMTQPVLDILTYLSITYWNLDITIGIVVRVLFMFISLVYIIWGNRHLHKKIVIGYLFVLFAVIGVSFILNILTKPQFYFFSEVQYVVKTIYFPVLLCTFYLVITEKGRQIGSQFIFAVMIAMLILSLSIFAAIITNTSNSTYTYAKSGYIGWFYAGNEISAIVAITMPLVLVYALQKTNQWKDIYYWFPALLLAITGLLIGTKVSFFAVLGTMILALLLNTINRIIRKLKSTSILMINVLLLALFLLFIPISPAYENIRGDYSKIQESQPEEVQTNERELLDSGEMSEEKVEGDPFLQSRLVKVLLSSRNEYFADIYMDFKNAGLLQKLFGLGYAGYYTDVPKLIEMDFFDLFFSYGIGGFFMLLVPYVLVFWRVLMAAIKNFTFFIRTENVLLAISGGLGIGVAFLAGHVLYSPAVSIYLALVLVLLYTNNSDHILEERKKRGQEI